MSEVHRLHTIIEYTNLFAGEWWHTLSLGIHLHFTVADLEIQKGGFSEARPQIFGLPRPLLVTLEVHTEYLEATLGLVKCLEISKELIRECVTCLVVVAACHSCIII